MAVQTTTAADITQPTRLPVIATVHTGRSRQPAHTAPVQGRIARVPPRRRARCACKGARRGQAPAQAWSRCAPDTQLQDTKPSTNHAQQYRPMLRPLGARRDSDQTHTNHICAAPRARRCQRCTAEQAKAGLHIITSQRTAATKFLKTSPTRLGGARHCSAIQSNTVHSAPGALTLTESLTESERLGAAQARTGKITLDTILRDMDDTTSCLQNHSAHSVASTRLACIARRGGARAAAPPPAPPRPACACSASSATRVYARSRARRLQAAFFGQLKQSSIMSNIGWHSCC